MGLRYNYTCINKRDNKVFSAPTSSELAEELNLVYDLCQLGLYTSWNIRQRLSPGTKHKFTNKKKNPLYGHLIFGRELSVGDKGVPRVK